MSEIIQLIVDVFLLIGIVIFLLNKTGVIKFASDLYKHKSLSKDTETIVKSDKELFERKYYKDISTTEVIDLLKKWIMVIYDPTESFLMKPNKRCKTPEEKKNVINKQMRDMHINLMLYCSSTTLKLFALYMKDIYDGRFSESSDEEEKKEQLFVVALIISNIKYDYSGDFIDPLNILRIKVKQIDDYTKTFNKLEKTYKEFLRG